MSDAMGEVKGVDAELGKKLAEHNLRTVDQFLAATKTPANRRDLAKQLGMDNSAMTELVNRADLSRVKGIGDVFADMLEIAGVDSVKELAGRKPENLHDTLVKVNTEQKIAARTPTLEMVQAWVTEAKELPKIVEY